MMSEEHTVHWSICSGMNSSLSSSCDPKSLILGVIWHLLYCFQMYTPDDETTWSVLPLHLENKG